jgi:xanthine dehydrogenase accessory factor
VSPDRICGVAPDLLDALRQALALGESVALITIVSARGSTPQRVGAKMLVHADGRTLGTIGGGCYESDAFGRAREALRTRTPVMVHYDLTDDVAEETGLICGGQMDVFIDVIEPPPTLYIVGAGHVGHQLGRLAPSAGFTVHVVDDRQKFANPERFPEAHGVHVADIGDWLADANLPESAYVVIVTRGHRHDFDALRALAGRNLRYIGVIGSRAKIARLIDLLVHDGVSADWLRRLHAPIGVDIGAVTPEEIGVSILAELIAVRRGKSKDGAAVESMRWTAPALRDGST